MTCKPLPIFSNMPWHVKQKIVGFTSPYTQMNLQLCSKDLRKVVDKAPSVYKGIEIILFSHKVSVSIYCNDRTLSIDFEARDGRVVIEKTKSYTVVSSVEVEGDFLEEAIKYLGKIFYKTPRNLVTVQQVNLDMATEGNFRWIGGYEDLKLAFIWKLQEISVSNLHVGKLELNIFPNDHNFASVLRCFYPGTLRSIRLDFDEDQDHLEVMRLPEVIASEQWKQARQMGCFEFICDVPYETWKHLEFSHLNVATLDLSVLKDVIRRIGQSPTWKVAVLSISPSADIRAYFQKLDRVPNTENEAKISIPDCDTHVVYLKLHDGRVEVLKLSITDKPSDFIVIGFFFQ